MIGQPGHPAPRRASLAGARRGLSMLLVIGMTAATAGAREIRRPIVLPKGRHAVVLVRFMTCGQSDAQGRGIAVTDARGEAAPYRLLTHDPQGETVLAAPGDRGGLTLHYDRVAHRKAKPDESLAVSMIQRTWSLPRGRAEALDTARRSVNALRPQGVSTVANVFSGHNPHGPDEWYYAEFEGVIRTDKPQHVALVAATDDLGEVELDGRVVIAHPERTVVRSNEQLAAMAQEVTLTGGQRIVYRQVQREGQSIAVLARVFKDTKRGSDKPMDRALPLDHGWFRHDPWAALGPAEREGDAPAVGFDVRLIDAIGMEQRTYYRVELKAIAPAGAGRVHRWRFGSSATAEGDRVVYIFTDDPSSTPISLDIVERGSGARLGAAEGRVSFPEVYDLHSPQNTGLVRDYAREIAVDRMTWTQAEPLGRLLELIETAEDPQLIGPIAMTYLELHGERDDAFSARMRYLAASAIAGRDPAKASEMFGRLSRVCPDRWLGARAAAEMLDLMLHRLDQADRVEGMVTALAAAYGAGKERVLIQSRLGDLHRMRGEVDEALEAYEAAQQIATRRMSAKEQAVMSRAFRESALSLLEQQRWPSLRDTLHEWEATFPTDKLTGDLILLTGRYFQGVGDDARAAREYEQALTLYPVHPSRPEIAYRLGEALLSSGARGAARRWLHEVVEQYPKSPFAAEARKLLPKAGG